MPKCRVIRPDVNAQMPKRLKEEGILIAKLAEKHGVRTKTIYG